ncbi:MAG: hypothetical protein ACLTZY_02525 [Alistipes indistinctus]
MNGPSAILKIADSKNLEYTFTSLGTFTLTLHASQGTTVVRL